ncbi:hypothetical protein BH24ACT9_BH24ACT9_18050 [soil metagenome]
MPHTHSSTSLLGSPGPGKTTLARSLAEQHTAVRFNPDEWMSDLCVDLFDEPFRERLEKRMISLAGELLAQGGSVVIEFGSWSRRDRDQLMRLGRAARMLRSTFWTQVSRNSGDASPSAMVSRAKHASTA